MWVGSGCIVSCNQPSMAKAYITIIAIRLRYDYDEQESPAVADKPARRLRKVRTVYVRAVGL